MRPSHAIKKQRENLKRSERKQSHHVHGDHGKVLADSVQNRRKPEAGRCHVPGAEGKTYPDSSVQSRAGLQIQGHGREH